LTPIVGRFVRLRALSEVNGNPWISAAEVSVSQACPVVPSVLLSAPQTYYLQRSGSLLVQAIACLDPALNSGWGVRFALDGGSAAGGAQFDVYTPPFQGTFLNVAAGEHTVDVYIIDNGGNVVTGASTHDSAQQVGIGDYYVGVGDSITGGTGDTVPSDDTSQDLRNTGGGYTPILNDLLSQRKLYPQNVANEGLLGGSSSDGAARIAGILARHPNAQVFLVEYGTNDSGLARASGLNLKPGDTGYAGSYKDYMQRVINAINAAGKKVALAKAPVVLENCNGTCALFFNASDARNTLIQQYNQVIDQLVFDPANKITVTPPDLYTYFSNHWQTEYHDILHPNGIGYQSSAGMWAQAVP